MSLPEDEGIARRAVLRRLATAGAVGWVAPVILSSSPVAAGVFTTKCAPGTVSASRTWVRSACLFNGSRIDVTITFSGACPCGGTKVWCSQKYASGTLAPDPTTSSTTATLSFTQFVPIGSFPTVVMSGKVALGCTDRDGDRQFAVYDWTISANDNGGPCSTVVNTVSGITLSNRTLVTSLTCPSLAAFASPATNSSPPSGATRSTS